MFLASVLAKRITRICGVRTISAVLYAGVLIAAFATLLHLNSFFDSKLAETKSRLQNMSNILVALLDSNTRPVLSGQLKSFQNSLGENGVIALFDENAEALYRLPDNDPNGQFDIPSWQTFALSHSMGNWDIVSQRDGIHRIWAYAKGEHYIVLIGRDRALVTADVAYLAGHMTALMVAVTLGVVFLTHLLQQLALRRQIEQTLINTSSEAVAAANTKTMFLANMSHELRTPITGVLGMADLLAQSPLDQEQTRMLNTMRSSAKTLLTVLNDILDYSKVETGELKLEKINITLADMVNGVVQLLTPAAMEKGLSIKAQMAEDLPKHIIGDPTRIQQILFNLLGNAIKFTDKGHITLIVEKDDLKPQYLRFSVIDTGIGIGAETLERLFAPFTQADASTTRRYGGTGLGLAIAKKLVELMGGEITAQSTPDQGSNFAFSIYFAEGEPEAEETLAPLPEIRSLNILVAEDNEVNQMLISKILENLGHKCLVVDDGRAALEEAAVELYDVVLMDMQMPVMDGATAARLIRNLPAPYCHVPIIALTADAMLDHRQRYMEAGLDDLLTKPISLKDLTQALHRAITGAPRSASISAITPTSDVLDSDYLKDICQWVGVTTLRQLLDMAPETFRSELDNLKLAIAKQDHNALRETAHRLKGAAGSVGCQRLVQLAQDIQTLPDHTLPSADQMGELEVEINRALSQLQHYELA